jgi:precorrin-2 dehydrogenase/sirohydrochlorin ferrochelatase
MAKTLRKRIERLITKEDLLHIELQEYLRAILKREISEQKFRKKILYEVLEDKGINELLKRAKMDKAKKEALTILERLRAEENLNNREIT